MPAAADRVALATPGGYLLVLAMILPVVGMLAIAGARRPRHAGAHRARADAAGLGVAVAIAAELIRTGAALIYVVGGWQPPLGLALRADGLSGDDAGDDGAGDHGAIGLFARGHF